MQPAAACTVQVRGPAGVPVSGAWVGFSPNVRWTPGLATIFCEPILKMEKFITPRRQFESPKNWMELNPFAARTDAQGNATVRNLPPLTGVAFGVNAEGYEPFPSRDPSNNARRPQEQTDILVLVPGGSVTATARLEKKSALPAPEETAADEPTPPTTPAPRPRRREESTANAALAVLPANGPDTFSGRLVDEADKGLPGVLVDAWTWLPGNETTTDADGQARRLDIAVRSGVVFRARVVDSESGAPVAGAKLSNREHPGTEGVSGANGTLEIRGLLPGKFEFEVAAAGCTRWWSEQCSKPWSRFEPESSPGNRWQRNFDSLDFDLQPDQPPVTITLERGVRIVGRALDPDGQPIGGATVAPALTGTGNSITGDTRFSVPTRADGTFEMLLPASKDAEYNLVVHDGKFGQWRRWANGTLPPFRTRPGQTLTGVEIRLNRPAVVRGRATDAAGRPVTGQDVRGIVADHTGNRYYDPETTTDPDGRFELRFLSPGPEIITLYRTPIQTAVNASADQAVNDVLLRPPDEGGQAIPTPAPSPVASPAAANPAALDDLHGLIHDAGNHPVPGAEVVLVGVGDGEHTMYSCAMPGPVDARATTDAAGRFVLHHADRIGRCRWKATKSTWSFCCIPTRPSTPGSRRRPPPGYGSFFAHELTLRQLMHDSGGLEWRLAGRVMPPG